MGGLDLCYGRWDN
jgi:phospholipase D1/2